MGKQSKNLAKVQSMLDGTYGGKIQSGYIGEKKEHRKVGDKWVDSDGNRWEQKEGYRTKNTSNRTHHSWDMKCSDCDSFIIKPWDKDVYKADGRCYYCQMDYEIDLKTKPLRWFAYRRLKDLKNMEAIEKDMIQWIDEMTEQRKKNPFDEKVANALANGEVEMSVNKNLQ